MGILKKAAQALVLFSLIGCSAQYHLKRALELDPNIVKRDTLIQEVPVITPEVQVDTTFVPKPGDTVVIQKDRLRMNYVKLPGDTVYLEGECLSDTVYVEVKIPQEVYVVEKGYKDWVKELLGIGDVMFWALHISLILLIVGLILRRIFG